MPEMWLALLLAVMPTVELVQTGWRPIPGPGPSLSPGPTIGPTLGPTLRPSHSSRGLSLSFPSLFSHQQHSNMCVLYKSVFDQDMFPQYVQYKTQIPDLKEFTLCLWHKFYNHSQDQPLFSYAHQDKARGIYSWVANTDKSSFYMMAINGQTIYRLNYPVRLHKWYHTCQSWNGKTGEWQIWVNAERIGRGFHNLLVGKPVRGGGMAITGQEQQKYGFPSRKGGGLLGEVTLVNLYKAALTAGKAYTNHKHHHVHHFHHEDKAGEDDYDINPPMMTPAPPQQPSSGTQFPFLSNGQLLPMLPITQLTAFQGPGGSKNINLFTPFNSHIDILLPGMQRLFKRDQNKQIGIPGKRMKKSEDSDDVDDVVDAEVGDILKLTTKELRKVKREASEPENTMRVAFKEDDILKEGEERSLGLKKRQTTDGVEMSDEKNQKKRTLFNEQFQFGLIPGDDLSGLFPGDGYVLGGGGLKFEGEERNKLPNPTESQVQMEPAEWEVRRIMAVCSGCSEDPFRKASIISWRESPKKVYAGAHYVPATPECQRF